MVNLVGPPMVPGQIYLTRLAGNRPGLVMLKPKKPRRPASPFGIVAIAQAISPFFFTEKSIKELRREFATQYPSATVEKPVITAGGPENVEPPAGLPANPPVEPPVEPPAASPAEPPADQPADPPVEPAADPSAGPPVDPPADPPAEPSNDPPTDPPDPPPDPPDPPPNPPPNPPPEPPDPPPGPPSDLPPAPPSAPPSASPSAPPSDPPPPPAEPPTNSPAGPPIEPPLNPGAAITANHVKIQSLVILPTCAHCGKIRSPSYQRRHPLAPNEIPKVGFCRNCAKKETSSEGSDDDNKGSRRRHRRRHLRPLGRETWAEYLGLTDKSYHPIVQTSRRRSSQKTVRPSGSKKLSKSSNGKRHKKNNTSITSREATLNSAVEQKISPEPVRRVRRTTNANGSSQARSGGTPRASSRKRSAEKTASTRSARSPGRLSSSKPIRKVRRTTYVYRSKPSQAGGVPRPSANANLIEKSVEELSFHNDGGEPSRSFNVDLKPKETKNGEGHDTKSENGRPTIRHLESLFVEPGTPQSTYLHHYSDRGRAPDAKSGHADYIKGFSYRRETLGVEGLHRSRTRSVRLIRVDGELDSLFSSSSSAQTSPRGTELASRPPSRTTRVLKAQSDGLRSRSQSPRNGPPASELGRRSRPPSRSVRVFRADSDGLRSRPQSPRNDPPASELGRRSRPPSRSVRVVRADSDGLRSRPQSPRNDLPASEFRMGSRPPSRSVRVFRADSDGLRSRPQSSRNDPSASELGRRSRPPSRSVRVFRAGSDGLRSRAQSPRNDPPASEFGQRSRPPSQVSRAIRVPSDGLRSSLQSPTDDRAPSELDRKSRPPSRSVRVLRVNPDGFSSRPQSTTNDRAPSEPEQEPRSPSRPVRALRINPDDFQSHPHSPTGDQAPSKSRQQSQPPSRSIRVLRVQHDVLHSRPQSPAVNETASNSDRSFLAPQSEQAVRARPDRTHSRPTSAHSIQMPSESYGSRPPSQSGRVLHVQPDVSAQRMQSPTQFYESRPPSRSDGIGRVSQESSRLRSNSRDLRTRPGGARKLDEPRPRSSFRRIHNEVEDVTGPENVSPDWYSIRPNPRSPSPICGGNSREGVKRLITRRQRTRYHGSESSSDSVSILPPPKTRGSIHSPDSNTTHPLRILRMRHLSTSSDPEKTHPSDRHSAPVSPLGRVFGVRYVSPRAPTSRSLNRPHQPEYRDEAPPAVSAYSPQMGNRAAGSSRIKYRPNEDWPASRENSPGSNQANRSNRKKYRPSEDMPESPENSQVNNQRWRENRANSKENNEKMSRIREHLPDYAYSNLEKRVSRSGRKKYRPSEDWPESPETSQVSNQEWHENRANSQEREQDWAGGEEQLPQRNEDWRGIRASSRPSSTPRSRAVSKSSGKPGGEAAAAEW